LVCAGTVLAHPAQQPVPLPDGPTLFRERGCAQCHTIGGTGGHKGPDLSGVGRRLKDPAIQLQIERGGDQMPPFADAIPPTEIEALVHYLHKCRDRHPKAIKPAPAF